MNLQDIYRIASDFEYVRTTSIALNMADNQLQIISDSKEIQDLVKAYSSGYIKRLDKLISHLKKHSLSNKTQAEMRNISVKLMKNQKEAKSQAGQYRTFIKTVSLIDANIGIWIDRVYREIGELIIIKPYLDGDLNYEKLRKGIEVFFEPNVWRNMQEIEKNDLQDFKLCYISKAWTSAGIMAMRVIESAMRNYYTIITKGKTLTNWNEILNDLKKNHPKADKDLLKKLEYIKDNLRNPLAHPELRIEAHETEEAFHHAKYVVNKVYS